MIGALMRECNNYFERGWIAGDFEIADGCLLDQRIGNGQWIAITGSTWHDGVFRILDGVLEDAQPLPNERFNGRVWILSVPRDFVKLAEDVAAFEAKRPAGSLASESFGAYSRSFATGAHGALTWQEAFADRLRPYRRMFTEVHL